MKQNIVLILLVSLFLSKIGTNHASKVLICEVIAKTTIYDCSNLSLEWSDLENSLIEPTRTATSLNLASNNFDSHIANKTFNVFKLLDQSLNLSSNGIASIESHGFFVHPDLKSQGRLKSLGIKVLDLSFNSFQIIPWNAIKSLYDLEKLYFNGNKNIMRLDSGDLTDVSMVSFLSLTHIYFNSCSIEYVDSKVLENFKSLKFIDLSFNQLHNVNERVGNVLQSLGGVMLKLNQNSLSCDCDLLWLKKYLLKYDFEDAKCILKSKILTEQERSLTVKAIPVNLASNPYEDEIINSPRLINASNPFVLESVKSIRRLDDSQFSCDLKFGNPNDWFQINELDNRYEITLTCVVSGYPRPSIRWNENNKSLNKKSTYKTFSIEETEINDPMQTSSYLKTVQSSLKFFLALPIRPSLNGYRNYSCRAMINADSNKHMTSTGEEIDKDTVQKVVDFKVYHGIDFSYTGWFSSGYVESTDPSATDAYYTDNAELQGSQLRSRQRPFIYWIILTTCLLFALVIVLFATYCIVRNNHKSNKMRQELMALGGSHYNNSSIYKRSAIYLNVGSTATNTRASSAMTNTENTKSILKPDNIREHQEYSTIYFNQRSQSDSVHYTNINFHSPSSLIMQDATELLRNDISYDGMPVESSPIHSSADSDEDGTKSYDENIVDYQDPELIDLRRPGQVVTRK